MSEFCDACGSEYDYIYWVPDHVWGKIKPLDSGDGGLLCLLCVHHRSKEAGFVLRFSGSDKWWITDELTAAKAENEDLRQQLEQAEQNCRDRIKADRLYNLKHGDEFAQDMARRLEQAEARCAELEKDAARYQYIRNNQYWTRNSGNDIDPGFSCVGAKFAYEDDFQAKPMLDHHIDQRLRQQANKLEQNQ